MTTNALPWTPELYVDSAGFCPYQRFIDELDDATFAALDAAVEHLLRRNGMDLCRTEALALAGRPAAAVTPPPVPTPEDATRLRFRGSPTILIDGADPFADKTSPVGLACRVLPTPDGLRGAPTVEQLVKVLR